MLRSRSPRTRSLRHLHALHHSLSNASDCCARRTRCAPMHLLSDDRKARRDSRRAARRHGPARFRLRHLSGRLPVESQSARNFRARIPSTRRAGQSSARLASRNAAGRISRDVSRIADPARQAFRPAAKCGDCHGKQRRREIRANAKETLRRFGPSSRGTRQLGSDENRTKQSIRYPGVSNTDAAL